MMRKERSGPGIASFLSGDEKTQQPPRQGAIMPNRAFTDVRPLDRPDFHLKVLEDINKLVNQERDLNSILGKVARRLAEALRLDVASVYLFDEKNKLLVMRATHGLTMDPSAPVSLSPDEGLTGLVFKSRRPVLAAPASSHPAYKFFPGIGEERFESYIGVPMVLGARCLGVLVGQAGEQRAIHPAEQTLLNIVASRLAGLLEVSDKLERLKTPAKTPTERRVLQGKGVSTGVAVGRVLLFQGLFQEISLDRFVSQGAKRELKRLAAAFKHAEQEIRAFIKEIEKKEILEKSESAIFQAHLYILKDPSFRKTIERLVEKKGAAAEAAVVRGAESIIAQFESHGSAMLRERAADIREIGERILAGLLGEEALAGAGQVTGKGAVLVAHDIGPAYLAKLGPDQPAAIITESGGETSHAAILAKSLGIPAVVGVEGAVRQLPNGLNVLVDGKTGFVFLSPEEELVREYAQTWSRQAEIAQRIHRETADAEGVTPFFKVTANVGFPADMAMAREFRLRDVGLFRTEFTFMRFTKWPTVAQQEEIYEEMARNFEGYVTVRTLDIGGDKMLPYVQFPREDNPLLGLRSIRFSMENLSSFRNQVEAILRACLKGHRFRILLPMVSYMWEMETAAEIMDERVMRMGLRPEQRPPLGIMCEVPALLYQLPDYKDLIDFVSVGSNDLIQYLLAVDRNSNVVGHLYSGYHPAVIRMFAHLIETVAGMGKEISVCGEFGATPAGALALAALGCRSFSVAPPKAPALRYLARRLSRELLDEVAGEITGFSHERDVRRYLAEKVEAVAPVLLETE
jgi:phosphotransferase system enzyme I (PtsP)